MKKLSFLSLQIVFLITVIYSCSDKVVQEPTYTTPPSPPGNPTVTPSSTDRNLRVDAGIDQVIFLPLTGTYFRAYASDFSIYPSDLKYEWKKIKGPEKYKMDDSTKANPILSNLETGQYEFSITATTTDGRFDTDTVKIQVVQSFGEFIIPNLSWSCDGDCGLQIQIRIHNDTPIRIYIKPEGLLSNWVEAPSVFSMSPPYPIFYYGINNGSLWITSDNQSGNCDIKIVFQ